MSCQVMSTLLSPKYKGRWEQRDPPIAVVHVLGLNKGQITLLQPRHESINHIGSGSAGTRCIIQILHHEVPYDFQVLWFHTSLHHVRRVVRTWIILLRRVQYRLQRSRKKPDGPVKIVLSEFLGDVCGSLNNYGVGMELVTVCEDEEWNLGI